MSSSYTHIYIIYVTQSHHLLNVYSLSQTHAVIFRIQNTTSYNHTVIRIHVLSHTHFLITCSVPIYLYTCTYIFIVNSLPLHTYANVMVVTFHPLSQLMPYTHDSLILYLLIHKRISTHIHIQFLIIILFILFHMHHLFYHYIIHMSVIHYNIHLTHSNARIVSKTHFYACRPI